MALVNAGKAQPSKTKDNTSLVKILAILILGGASVYVALLGLYLNNLVYFWTGVIMLIMIACITAYMAAKVTFEVVDIIRNFRYRIRKRRKRKAS